MSGIGSPTVEGVGDAFVYAMLADLDDAMAGHDFDGEIREEEGREVSY